MNRILLNIRYKVGYQLNWVSWYLVIYVITMLLLSYGLIKTSFISDSSGSLIYRIWGSVIFQFAVTMKFKKDFDFFLTLSNTRNDIFRSLLGVAFCFSIFFSILIVMEKLIVDQLNYIFGYINITDPFHFISPYATENIFLQFLFFLMLCICCSVFGLLMGSLFYRFGKKFTLAFWLIFSSVPIVMFPLLLWPLSQRNKLSSFFTNLEEFLQNFDILVYSGYLFILTILFCLAAFINITKLPQK